MDCLTYSQRPAKDWYILPAHTHNDNMCIIYKICIKYTMTTVSDRWRTEEEITLEYIIISIIANYCYYYSNGTHVGVLLRPRRLNGTFNRRTNSRPQHARSRRRAQSADDGPASGRVSLARETGERLFFSRTRSLLPSRLTGNRSVSVRFLS